MTEEELYKQFDETQDLFVEVEVELVNLPINALVRIEDFLLSFSQGRLSHDEEKQANCYEEALLALRQAKYHCNKVLADARYKRAEEIRARYGDELLRNAGGPDYFAELESKQEKAERALENAYLLYNRKRKEGLISFQGQLSGRDNQIPIENNEFLLDELEAQIGEDQEIQELFLVANKSSKELLDHLIDSSDSSSDEDRNRAIDIIREGYGHRERNTSVKKWADTFANVMTGLGVAGIIVFFIRRLLGI